MADVLPLLQRDGQWVSPMADGYLPSLPMAAARSELGVGGPFISPRWPRPRTITLRLMLPDDAARAWFFSWYTTETKQGARRFGARLHLGGSWRYCVCSFASAATPRDWGRGHAAVEFAVELAHEYATEGELTGG